MGNFEKTFVRFCNEMVFLAFILGGKHFCFHCTDMGECVWVGKVLLREAPEALFVPTRATTFCS